MSENLQRQLNEKTVDAYLLFHMLDDFVGDAQVERMLRQRYEADLKEIEVLEGRLQGEIG